MVLGQLDQPLKGQRPQERPKLFLACVSRAEVAEVGWVQYPPFPFPPPSVGRCSAVHTVLFTCPPNKTVQE